MDGDVEVPLLLGGTFFITCSVVMDVELDELILGINNEHLTFNVLKKYDIIKKIPIVIELM